MAQLDQNLCRRKTKKKERKNGKEKKEKIDLDVFKCPPTKPTSHTHSLSFKKKKKKTMLPTIPFCNPPKNPHLHHCLSKEHYFSPSYVGFFGFLCLGQSFHRENRESKNLLTSSLISISFSFLFVFLVSFSLIFLPLLLSFFLSFKVSFFITYLSLSLFLFFITHLLSVFLSTSLFSLSLVFFGSWLLG